MLFFAISVQTSVFLAGQTSTGCWSIFLLSSHYVYSHLWLEEPRSVAGNRKDWRAYSTSTKLGTAGPKLGHTIVQQKKV